jgi:2-polyprenyl-6-methoxyphenol hydroxylase-like FAD-dependent oxidoreductase
MSPQLGQGANMALLDAWALGDAMQQSDNWHQVWAHYHQHRGPQIRFYQRMSRWLTPAFQSHSRVVATGRDLLFPLLNHLPWMRLQMARTIAGLKTGLLR